MFTPERLSEHLGSLHMRLGPMKARKTTWLNQTLTTHADLGARVLKIMSIKDIRPDVERPEGSTHHSSFFGLTEKITIIKTDILATVSVADFDVIGVEEGHFFTDIYAMVTQWVKEDDKNVLVVGLDGDFRQHPFIELLKLVPHADSAKKFNACCQPCIDSLKECNFKGDRVTAKAPFTRMKKVVKIEPSSSDQPYIKAGGSEMYEPVCRYHLSLN